MYRSYSYYHHIQQYITLHMFVLMLRIRVQLYARYYYYINNLFLLSLLCRAIYFIEDKKPNQRKNKNKSMKIM